MFKQLGNVNIDNNNVFLYKRAGKIYYSLSDLGKEIEKGDLKPVIENLQLTDFKNSL